MKCEYCGSELPNGTRICTVCGSQIALSEGTVYANDYINDNENLGDSSSFDLRNDDVSSAQTFATQQDYNFNQNNNFSQPQNFGQQQFNQSINSIPPIPSMQQGNDFNQQPQIYPTAQQPIQNGFGQSLIMLQPNLTKKQLIQLPNLTNVKKNVNGAAIIGYICVAATLIYNLMSGNPSGIFDAVLLLGLTLGIHLKYSRGCAIALLVYSIINVIVWLVAFGTVNGWLILVVGVYAVKVTSDFNKYWKSYITTGGIPPFIPKK